MKSRKREGVIRRPIEYVLWVVLLIVTVAFAWTVYLFVREDSRMNRAALPEQRLLDGTIDEIDWLTEQDAKDELAVTNKLASQHKQLPQSLDAAADNIGSAADESLIPSELCIDITSFEDQIEANFSRLINEYTDASSRFDEAYARENDNALGAIAASRAEHDIKRSDSLSLLLERTRQENKQLAEEFREKTDELIARRRVGADGAHVSYVSTVSTAIETRRTLVQAGMNTYRTQTLSALQRADRSCRRRNPDVAAIKQELAREINQARLGYADVLRERSDIKDEINKALSNIQEEYRTHISQFEQAIKSLQTDFQVLRRERH